ncbi:MAG: DNA translocase FtsK [Pseudomonadota bacterium]
MTRHIHRGLREGALFVLGAAAVYMLVALISYDPADPGWSHAGDGGVPANLGGVAGAWFADLTLYTFGYMAYLIPLLVAYTGWWLSREDWSEHLERREVLIRVGGGVLVVLGGAGLAGLHFGGDNALPMGAGGVIGTSAGLGLIAVVGFLGATLFLLALFLTGVPLLTRLSWFWLMDVTGALTLHATARAREKLEFWGRRLNVRWTEWRARQQRQNTWRETERKVEERRRQPAPRIEPVVEAPKPSERVEREKQTELFEAEKGALPPLSILNEGDNASSAMSEEALEAVSRLLEKKLADFGVNVQVVEVQPGPVITRYEVELAPGVKSSKISGLATDLARAMSVSSVRVVEVIPGKTTIGLEIPNEQRETVYLADVLRSQEFEEASSPVTLALGKDISGQPLMADLAKMPHLLVAGATGTGKSVAVNAMIMSLLYRARPDEVRMIMVDPKMLELSVYDGIPHLLTPVVTDMNDAAGALRWCVAEMDRRYKLMAALGVRNLNGYNRKVEEASAAGTPLTDPLYDGGSSDSAPLLEKLPTVVIVVDEFADLIMVVGKKVEELIARLAQKARAAGLHLILATQRPSVDVITGLIKANIPTRIAFQVSSRVDSRTILDQGGAEHLLGNGDMLYLPGGRPVPERVHGAFVDDDEVHQVAEFLKQTGEPEYIENLTEGGDSGEGLLPGEAGESDGESDPLYDQAVQIVTESRRASISGVQRRLKIGYNRAARLIEEMERAGVVTPMQSNGGREVIAPPPPGSE